MLKCVRMALTSFILLAGTSALAQKSGPCQHAEDYSPPEPGLLAVVPALRVQRVFGRAVIEAKEALVPVNEMGGACLSLFTEEKHRFVASVPVDSRGRFEFRGIAPGKYRLIARSPGFCTGNALVEVTSSGVKRGKNGVFVHFRIHEIDACTYADYDGKAKRDRGAP
jgi:hypothetical protein